MINNLFSDFISEIVSLHNIFLNSIKNEISVIFANSIIYKNKPEQAKSSEIVNLYFHVRESGPYAKQKIYYLMTPSSDHTHFYPSPLKNTVFGTDQANSSESDRQSAS